MKETDQNWAQPDLSQIESINNIETARMALRWALERIHALETSLSSRTKESSERDLYYSKIEQYLSQKLEGKLNAEGLAKKEVELGRLEKLLDEKLVGLQKDWSAKKEALELDYQRLKTQTETGAQEQIRRAEAALVERRRIMDQVHVARMVELNEKEGRLRAQEEALGERQANFEKFYSSQKAQLEQEIQNFHATMEDQVQFRLKNAERLLANRHDSMEGVWAQEKTALLQELLEWRRKAQEHLPQVFESQRQVTLAEEAAREAARAAQRRIAQLQEEEKSWEKERQTLLDELKAWQRKAGDTVPQILKLEKSLAQAQETAERSANELAQETARRLQIAEREKALQSDYETRLRAVEAEHQRVSAALAKRRQVFDELESKLLSRFQDVEEEISRRDGEWKVREENLRQRDRNWHETLGAWQAELSVKQEHLEKLRMNLLEAVRTYKNKSQSESPRRQ